MENGTGTEQRYDNITISEVKPIIDYIPARYHEGKSWYIDYYAYHPGLKKLQRKQIKVNRIKNITERRKYVKRLTQIINLRLAQGWNPFIEQEAPKSYNSLIKSITTFLEDKRALRNDTLRSYKNFLKIFKDWIYDKFDGDTYIININNRVAVEFMEDMWGKNIGQVRYNNYLAFQILFFNWLIEHNYSKNNPFKTIKKKKEPPKIRIMDIPVEDRKKIKNYLQQHNKQFYIMVLLAFHTLIRPKEITYLRPRDINIKKQTIIISEKIAKNHRERIATIPNVMINDLKRLINNAKRQDWLLFSSNFLPGKKRIDAREITRYWSGLRETLKLKKELQFYSLRDSGIIQKLRDGFDPKTVMELADHSSLEVTNKYVKIAKKEANRDVIERSTGF